MANQVQEQSPLGTDASIQFSLWLVKILTSRWCNSFQKGENIYDGKVVNEFLFRLSLKFSTAREKYFVLLGIIW